MYMPYGGATSLAQQRIRECPRRVLESFQALLRLLMCAILCVVELQQSRVALGTLTDEFKSMLVSKSV